MTRARVVTCLALLVLPACFDPLVGAECAGNLTVCGNACSTTDGCGLDGGYDLGALDLVEDDGASPSSPLDSSAVLDQGGGGLIDVGLGEAAKVADAARGADRSPDLAADTTPSADRPDVARADTAAPVADTNKPPPADTKDATLPDTGSPPPADTSSPPPADAKESNADRADSATPGGSDSAVIVAPDVRDTPAEPIGPDMAEAAAPRPEPGRDGPSQLADTPRMDLPPKNEAGCPGQQISCSGRCVDDNFDLANCGGCGQTCSTGTCRFGSCSAIVGGQLVVIGHDLQTTNADMNRIFTNAILLSGSNPLRVAEYVGVAGPTTQVNSHAAIAEAATAVGRQVDLTQVTPDDLPSGLAHADVFLIQSQTTASDGALIELGRSWTPSLSTFVHTGGIIVVLDGSYPTNSGTVRILVEAGLANIAAVNVANNDFCTVKTATDPVATSVSTPGYKCLPNSTSYKGTGIRVIEDMAYAVVLRFTF